MTSIDDCSHFISLFWLELDNKEMLNHVRTNSEREETNSKNVLMASMDFTSEMRQLIDMI